MKAVIDRDGCTGCSLCVDTCHEVFRMAEDGLAEVHGEVNESNVDRVREAVENCPVSVITLEE